MLDSIAFAAGANVGPAGRKTSSIWGVNIRHSGCGAQGQIEAAAAAEGGETRAVAVLRAALDDIQAGVRAALTNGTLQCAGEPAEDAEAAAAAAAAAHKAELRARLASLQQAPALADPCKSALRVSTRHLEVSNDCRRHHVGACWDARVSVRWHLGCAGGGGVAGRTAHAHGNDAATDVDGGRRRGRPRGRRRGRHCGCSRSTGRPWGRPGAFNVP